LSDVEVDPGAGWALGIDFEVTMQRKCFLDMDGVIADFMGSLCRAHGRLNPYADAKALGCWDTEKLWGITEFEFWRPIVDHSLEFWETIEKTPEADELVKLACLEFGTENVAILTAPSKDHGSVPGKRNWIERHYPCFSKRMIFTTAKAKCFVAGPGKFLLDDKDSNVDEFDDHGGVGILVPRPWNAEHMLEGNLVGVVKDQIREGKRHGW
jgi:5'(3')-deoxyribonucleotidase